MCCLSLMLGLAACDGFLRRESTVFSTFLKWSNFETLDCEDRRVGKTQDAQNSEYISDVLLGKKKTTTVDFQHKIQVLDGLTLTWLNPISRGLPAGGGAQKN